MSFNDETHHATAAAQLTLRDGVRRVALEAGVVDAFHTRVPFDGARHRKGRGILSVDAERQRLQAA